MEKKNEYFKELLEKYMKMEKEELAVLLATKELRNSHQDKPWYIDIPLYDKYSHKQVCKSWEDCTNPHYDCINCPLRNFLIDFNMSQIHR